MPADNIDRSVARKIHALLLDAHPQRDSRELAAALELAASQTGGHSPENHRAETILAIEALNRAVNERTSACDAERLLLNAIGAARHWVQSGGA
jgi:hypothetical protein